MSAARRPVGCGTAGPIDHGKTALVKALTGTDTDRLPEEKARGIPIDLGFAFLEEAGGLTIEIVDVPGHERFIRNMLAGVGGIDLAMLVIAADEGVMPQTREHLAICTLLHIKGGLVALTKADLVEPDWLELVREDVAGAVRGTFLERPPILPVSAKTGRGLDALRAALRGLAAAVPERGIDQLPRLPIDRVFTVKGFGTVVTGTLTAGALAADERVEVYPKKAEAKIRGLQTHGRPVASARAGQRTAINLQGLERAAIARGDVVGLPAALQAQGPRAGRPPDPAANGKAGGGPGGAHSSRRRRRRTAGHPRGPRALRSRAPPRPSRRPAASRPGDRGGPRLVHPSRQLRRPAHARRGGAHGVPPREPAQARDVPRGAPRPGGGRRRARLRVPPDVARRGGHRQDRS